MNLWLLGGVANVAIAGCYLTIAWITQAGLTRTHQWGRNRLGAATFLIFLSCGIGHGLHAEHLLISAQVADAGGLAIREAFGSWHVVGVELVTAGAAIWYLSQRRRYGALLSVAVFEDVSERQRTALEVHDDIIQGLVTARLAMELGDVEQATRAIDSSLSASRGVIDRMLEPVDVKAGDLRRRRSARPT